MHGQVTTMRSAFRFGYFHYAIFAAAGAYSAGVEVAVATAEHATHLDPVIARATLAVPVSLFVLGVWWLALRPSLAPAVNVAVVALCVVIAVSVVVPASMAVIAAAMVVIVVLIERSGARAPA
ncbi:MAG: low temperature requirement protein A [Candidatus Nanopelagicales bacterium]